MMITKLDSFLSIQIISSLRFDKKQAILPFLPLPLESYNCFLSMFCHVKNGHRGRFQGAAPSSRILECKALTGTFIAQLLLNVKMGNCLP